MTQALERSTAAPAALITGGTSGIGRATALLLHQQGYRVVVTGRDPGSIEAARQHLPGDVLIVHADARSTEDIDGLMEAVRTGVGSLDVVFLNAGVSLSRPIESVDESTFDDLLQVNVKGPYFTLQRALPLLRDGGSVIFTVGIGASRGLLNGSAAAATKGALLSLVPPLALELAPRRIRVNAVSPGPIDTPIWGRSGRPPDQLEQIAAAMAARVPLGRLGTPEEVAQVVAFLASDASSFITGHNIVVAGGAGIGF